MMSRIRGALRSIGDQGASAVEYGLMLTAVATLIVVTVFGFGQMVNGTFQKASNCIAAQGTGAPFPGCPVTPTGP